MPSVTADLRAVARGTGPTAVYARLALAYRADHGARLTVGEIHDLLLGDDAVETALNCALQDVADAANRSESSFCWQDGIEWESE